MTTPERRRADRRPVDLAGTLFLAGGGSVPVRIINLGAMGALVQVADLEVTVREGDRAVLDHPLIDPVQGTAGDERRRTACAVVRVDLDFEVEAVRRDLAVYFDGGLSPEGYDETRK